MLTNFDPLPQAGGSLKTIDKQVTVTGGQIAVDFKPIVKTSIVSAIEIVRHR